MLAIRIFIPDAVMRLGSNKLLPIVLFLFSRDVMVDLGYHVRVESSDALS